MSSVASEDRLSKCSCEFELEWLYGNDRGPPKALKTELYQLPCALGLPILYDLGQDPPTTRTNFFYVRRLVLSDGVNTYSSDGDVPLLAAWKIDLFVKNEIFMPSLVKPKEQESKASVPSEDNTPLDWWVICGGALIGGVISAAVTIALKRR